MACPFCKKEHEWGVEEALERLERGPAEVRAALSGVGAEELAYNEPKPGGWSTQQIISHLVDCEIVFSTRFRLMLAQDDPALPAFDQNLWAERLQAGREANNMLATFELLRRQNLGLLRAAAPAALDRGGLHPEYGRFSIREQVIHIAEHDSNHAAQIRRVRAAWPGRAAGA